MNVFRLEKPILDAIEKFVNARITAGKIPAGTSIKYLDFEPDEGFVKDADYDGAIAVYGSSIAFSTSSGSTTGDWESDSSLTVDCYGFGDPVTNEDDDTVIDPTVREAQNRAENLTSLAYQAIMDRRQIAGSTTEDIDPQFGSGVDFGADKYPISMQKFAPLGVMNSRKGVCIYRLIFKFGTLEEVTTEELGEAYAGSGSLDSKTYNPGEEPDEE